MQIPFIDLKSQYECYKEEINKEVLEVLSSTQFIMGPQVTLSLKKTWQSSQVQSTLMRVQAEQMPYF